MHFVFKYKYQDNAWILGEHPFYLKTLSHLSTFDPFNWHLILYLLLRYHQLVLIGIEYLLHSYLFQLIFIVVSFLLIGILFSIGVLSLMCWMIWFLLISHFMCWCVLESIICWFDFSSRSCVDLDFDIIWTTFCITFWCALFLVYFVFSSK